jgi:hypothetical protein
MAGATASIAIAAAVLFTVAGTLAEVNVEATVLGPWVLQRKLTAAAVLIVAATTAIAVAVVAVAVIRPLRPLSTASPMSLAAPAASEAPQNNLILILQTQHHLIHLRPLVLVLVQWVKTILTVSRLCCSLKQLFHGYWRTAADA